MKSGGQGHESSALRPGPIVGVALALIVLVALSFWAMSGLSATFEQRAERAAEPAHELATGRERPPAPRLQAQPNLEVQAHQREMTARAGEYAWIDAEAGVVRIPLERALELAAERGLPTFELAEEDR